MNQPLPIPETVQGAVIVERDKIVAEPSKMIVGLGYPVTYRGRLWWVVNVDGDTIRLFRGPKA